MRSTPATGFHLRDLRELRVKLFCLFAALITAGISIAEESGPHPSLRFGAVLFKDDFREGLGHWQIETERPGKIRADRGTLDVDVPAGATLWFRNELKGPIAIEFDATAIAAGGRNDRVSDLNCFWMARNSDDVAPVFARKRSGRFADYNDLLTYYLGLGGNNNTTTRFRRYVGDPVQRPLLPEHDLASRDVLLTGNRTQTITIVANGPQVEYWRNGQRLIRFNDAAPYTRGWFAFRTTQSHLRIEKFRVYALN
jgi:Domain of unknown function (DUF6250)